MKNLCHFLLLASALALALATPEAETKVEELEAEHRSAKPEPFLEKLAAAIFGSNDKTSSKRPVYQQTAGSVQRPVAVKPPRVPLAPRPPQPPRIPLQKRPQPVYNGPQVSASNNVQSFAPPQTGKKICLRNSELLRHFFSCTALACGQIAYFDCLLNVKEGS